MLKTIIAAAIAATAINASAEVLGIMDNDAGGQVRLTDRVCPDSKKLSQAITTAPGGKFMQGCWTMYEGDVMVVWETGDKRVYPITAFREPTKPAKAKAGSAL